MYRPIMLNRPIIGPEVAFPSSSNETKSENDEIKRIEALEQEIAAEKDRIDNKYKDVCPIGKTGTEVNKLNFVDEEEEEEDEEEDNDDDDSAESHDEDEDDEEIDMEIDEIEGSGSPSF